MGEDTEKPKIDVEGVRQKVATLIQGRGLKQTAVARQANVSTGALSKFLVGRYEGDNQTVAHKLLAWLDGVSKRDTIPSPLMRGHGFVRTTAAAKILAVADHAQTTADLGMIIGEPGVGKTTGLEYAKQTRASVWMATMAPSTAGQVPMLEELADVIGVHPKKGDGAAQMQREIVKRLRGSAGLLIVDEAQHLSLAAIETLRSIHDAAKIGAILAGNARLTQQVAQSPQVNSRIGRKLALRKPLRADVNALAAQFDIHERPEQDFLYTIAQQPGGLRCVVKTIRLAALAASADSIAIDTGLLAAAWSELALEDQI